MNSINKEEEKWQVEIDQIKKDIVEAQWKPQISSAHCDHF